jgi:hypothetical protein
MATYEAAVEGLSSHVLRRNGAPADFGGGPFGFLVVAYGKMTLPRSFSPAPDSNFKGEPLRREALASVYTVGTDERAALKPHLRMQMQCLPAKRPALGTDTN